MHTLLYIQVHVNPPTVSFPFLRSDNLLIRYLFKYFSIETLFETNVHSCTPINVFVWKFTGKETIRMS